MAQADYYLKIERVDGESCADGHKGEMDIESWNFSVYQTGTFFSGGGGGAGKAKFQDIRFTKKIDKASPKLMLMCATGQHLKQAVLTLRKAGDGQQDFCKIILTDVLVSEHQTNNHLGGDPLPTDEFSLNYAKIEFEYKPQKADGSLNAAIKAGYDVARNVTI